MSQQQLTVKASLKRGCQQKRLLEQADEIRRFGVDCDVSTNYEYLLAKITSVFPGLVNKSITLYWKDADGDMIAFSSDDELMEAIKGVSDGIFRVFIVEKKAPKNESQPFAEQMGLFHPGVTCDGCNGEVRGVRYKCTVCPDYDLCSQCKSTGMHGEHEMINIDRPQWPFCHVGMAFPGGLMGMAGPGGPMGMAGPGGPMGPGASMPPFMGHMPPPPPPASVPPFTGQMPPPPAYGCFTSPGGPGPQQHESAEVRRMNRKAWKRWVKETYGHGHQRKHKKEKREKKEKKEKKEGQKSSSSSSSDSEGDSSPTGEYLKNVGHSVAAMLDPLGIDVEVDVEHHGQRRRCHRGPMSPWGWRMRGSCGPWGMRGRGGWGCGWRRGHFGFAPEGSAPCASNSQPANSEQMTSGENSSAAGPADQQCTKNLETGEMASGSFSGSPDHDWTVLDNGGSAADVEVATAGVRDLDVSDNASRDEQMHLYIPSDPAIAHALESMMSMGYSNEGGWLTNLLVYHKGDIGRVLDAMHAKKP